MSKALRVCATCKTRKKACDKCLPICGYCDKRNLTCVYTYDEGHLPVQRDLLTTRTTAAVMTVDDLVHEQLRHVEFLTKLSIQEMIHDFFRGVGTVFPVIPADDPLWTNILVYGEDQHGGFSADAAFVVLAMYLLTMRSPVQDNYEGQATSVETVYISTKKLLSHVQSLRTASIYLLQANLLVAAFEYACCRPYAAYISVGVCSRMAMILGMGDFRLQNLRNVLGKHVFGGLVILERCGNLYGFRLVACEVDIPFTPSLDYYQQPSEVNLENQHTTMIDSEEKALELLRRVLLFTKSPQTNREHHHATLQNLLSSLQKITADLQDFLADALDSPPTNGAVIATAIRSLFSLHRYILDTFTATLPATDNSGNNNNNSNNQIMVMHMRETSLNALDTATRIMIDTSHDHVEYGIPHVSETFPLCGGYNLRCAMAHLEKYGAPGGRKGRRYYSSNGGCGADSDFAKLQRLYGAFCRRWKPIAIEDKVY